MSDEEKSAGNVGIGAAAAAVTVPPEQPNLDDEHTTVPNAPLTNPDGKAAAGKWQMPKPKFQQTSGYLPQGYLKDMDEAAAAAKVSSGSEDTTREQAPMVVKPQSPAPVPAPAIEPQPDLSDQLIPEEPAEAAIVPSAPVKSSSSAVMLVLGIIGILIFVVVVLAAVYFFFIAKQPASSNF